MRRVLMAVSLGLFLLAPASGAEAQYRAGRMWLLSSGVVFPMGPDDFRDTWKSGLALGGGIHHCLDKEQRVSLCAVLEYSRLTPQKNEVLDGLGVVDPETRLHVQDGSGSILQLGVSVKLSPRWTEGRFVPYAIGGCGVMRVVQDVTFTRAGEAHPEHVDKADTDGGWNLGAGVDVRVAKDLTGFIEGQYTIVFSGQAGPRYLPVRVGVLF